MESTYRHVSYAIIAGCLNEERKSQQKLYKIVSPVIYTRILQQGFREPAAEELLTQVFANLFSTIQHFNFHISLKNGTSKYMNKPLLNSAGK